MARGKAMAACLLASTSAFQWVAPSRRSRLDVARATPTPVERDEEPISKEAVREWMENMNPEDLDKELDLSDVPVIETPEKMGNLEEENAKNVMGDFDGLDDALEESWRVEGAKLCVAAGEEGGDVKVKDVYWEPGVLRIAVTAADGSPPDAEACAAASRRIVSTRAGKGCFDVPSQLGSRLSQVNARVRRSL